MKVRIGISRRGNVLLIYERGGGTLLAASGRDACMYIYPRRHGGYITSNFISIKGCLITV
jgi:hypothetical protein